MPSDFVISLDFELHWGVRDHVTVEGYKQNLLGVREAVPAMLDTFTRHRTKATWATVGMLFAETREELRAHSPTLRPKYTRNALDPYAAIDRGEVGSDERTDPYHLAGSLVAAIARTPGQEVGSHTFSHYYCLEPGQDAATFDADMRAAQTIAEMRGVCLESFVFPRNQVHVPYLPILRERGIRAFRGNPPSWLYTERPASRESLGRRALRLLDAYAPLTGQNASRPTRRDDGLVDVAASRFLRPFSPRLAHLDGVRVARIKREMTSAAQRGLCYHLWWHPHNFGRHLPENLRILGTILEHYELLRDSHGMRSSTMSEIAERLTDLPNS